MIIKRLNPVAPGESQPVLFTDENIRVGFVGGGPTEGRGFPQWAQYIMGGGAAVHYFQCFDAYGVSEALCGRVEKHHSSLYLPGNYPRCKDCERKFIKALRAGRPV